MPIVEMNIGTGKIRVDTDRPSPQAELLASGAAMVVRADHMVYVGIHNTVSSKKVVLGIPLALYHQYVVVNTKPSTPVEQREVPATNGAPQFASRSQERRVAAQQAAKEESHPAVVATVPQQYFCTKCRKYHLDNKKDHLSYKRAGSERPKPAKTTKE
jgi:hypothetical protein